MANIIAFDFWVDSSAHTFAIVFLDDGSAQQFGDVFTSPGTVIDVAPAGTMWNIGPNPTTTPNVPPAMISAGINGEVVVCIISVLGYFIWDGVNLFQSGTASPEVNLDDGGTGYTSPPTVGIYAGNDTGAFTTLAASIDNGSVSQVRVTGPGFGYSVSDANPIMVFSGGGQGDSAYGLAQTEDGVIVSITIVDGGSGFTSIPSLVITPVSGGSGASAFVTSLSGGVITGLKVLDGGSGYNQGATVATSGGGGTGAVFVAATADGVIVAVNVVSQGTGYSSAPDVKFIGTSGSGATGTAIFQDGSIVGVDMGGPGNGGSGYSPLPLVEFVGGGGPASGNVQLMPFGVTGTTLETYLSRLWIGNGNKLLFTDPGSLVSFGSGGGAFQSLDSTLKVLYTRLKQANGFLYLLGDSSISCISNVVTSGTPPVTTFQLLNVDPQVGCPWPWTVQNLGRRIIFATPLGVYAVLGGAAEKISGPLDGIFEGVNLLTAAGADTPSQYLLRYFGGVFMPTSAITQLFAKPTYALLLPIPLPSIPDAWADGTIAKRLLMTDGERWWTATQSFDMTWIAGVENFSSFSSFGTDGTNIYRMFVTPGGPERIVQSRLWVAPEIITQKKAWGLYTLWQSYSTAPVLTWTLDTEAGEVHVLGRDFTGPNGTMILPKFAWSKAAGIPSGTAAGQTVGFTMIATAGDFALHDIILVAQEYSKKF